MSIFDTLKAMIERDGRAVLVTITAVRGSSPREAGTRMVVRADGAFSGTIGGGALEWQALAEAQALLSGGGSRMRTLDKALGPDLGQCCGGRVKLMLERLERDDLSWLAGLVEPSAPGGRVVIGTPQPHGTYVRRWADAAEATLLPQGENEWLLPDGRMIESLGLRNPPVYLFGAGHVGRALILALAPLPLDLIWCDSRPEAFPSRVPQRVVLRREAEPERILADAPDDARILIMTHSHSLDLAIASAALSSGRFAYVGVIGSDTKRARFVSQMRQAGLTQAAIDRMVCPVGIPGIEGKEPAVIAASVVAQILLVESNRAAKSSALPKEAPVLHRSVGEKPRRNV
ncbi:xanthine dehydrogenase accessory protein XdhC [Labrys okinawensis]|uniref:xanthine dehydrogenase accessory protein XdhC n=1 Tax=Labrys okinawensis TaxID=346911 RepID=UPI0039BC26A7